MNDLGIFAKTFVRPRLEEVLDAVVAHGYRTVQFNLASAGLETVPASIDDALVLRIARAIEERGLRVAALSATFNLIHPDLAHRADHLARLGRLAAVARAIGAPALTLCAGTADRDDMWRDHPDNRTPEAWRELRIALDQAISTTERDPVLLLIEPEPGNVVRSAHDARRLLDEVQSPRVQVLADAANLLSGVPSEQMAAVLTEAVHKLRGSIALVHGKELAGAGQHTGAVPPGKGVLNWRCYFTLLSEIGYRGPIILHGFAEAQAAQALQFIRGVIAQLPSAISHLA